MRRLSFTVAASHTDAFLAALDDIPGLSVYAEAKATARGAGGWAINLLCGEGGLPDGAGTRISRMAETLGIPCPMLAGNDLPDLDWVVRSEQRLGPVRVGRFRIRGRHAAASADPAVEDIVVEAGRAFGSGHHATTRGCLGAIDLIARRRRIGRALDLGTGSGVLAIAMARRMRAPVAAIDIDPIAVAVAAENVRRNGVAHLVRISIGDRPRRAWPRDSVDLVVANILALPLVRLAPAVARAARRRAWLVLSGILIHQQAVVVAAYRRWGFIPAARLIEDEWATVMLARNAAPARNISTVGGGEGAGGVRQQSLAWHFAHCPRSESFRSLFDPGFGVRPPNPCGLR